MTETMSPLVECPEQVGFHQATVGREALAAKARAVQSQMDGPVFASPVYQTLTVITWSTDGQPDAH